MHVQHELGQRPLQARQRTLEHDEARTAHACRRLEIHETQRLAQLEMLPGGKIEFRRLTDPAQLLIVTLVLAVGHRLVEQVRLAGEHIVELGGQRAAGILGPLHLGL